MNRIYKIVRNQTTGQTVVTSEFAKGNKKSLSGKILALAVAGVLASTSITFAQAAEVTNGSNSGSGTLQAILSSISANDEVTFANDVNPNEIEKIQINQQNITIKGNGALDTNSTINTISNSIKTNREQADDNTAFEEWLNNDLTTEIDNTINAIGYSALTQITVADQSITAVNQSGLFYNKAGTGNGLNLENLHITMNGKISFSDAIKGGGLVGAHSNTADIDATIGDLSHNVFSGNNIDSSKGISGGGLIGVHAYSSSGAIGDINGNVFDNNHVMLANNGENDIYGGGLIGGYSSTTYGIKISIGEINGNVFINNRIDNDKYILGSGLIGAYSASSSISDINNNIFMNNTVTSNNYIHGGALISSYSRYKSSMGAINNNIFKDNSVITHADIVGGGLIGVYSSADKASIDKISGNLFSGNNVSAALKIQGGLIGVYTSQNDPSLSEIGEISDNLFTNNTIESTDEYIYGGILGQFSSNYSNSASWGGINQNIFTNNTITAKSSIYGGVLYSSGLNDELVISDAIISNNKITSENGIIYATAIGIDTRYETASAAHELTLAASNGGVTSIANHNDNAGNAAIYIGKYGSKSSLADAILNITPEDGGLVALYDSINVNQNNGFGFTMNINGEGDFYWGGKNQITADGGSFVNFNSGRTTLLSGYSLTDMSNNGEVNFNAGSTTLVQLTEDPLTQAPIINADKINVNSGSTFGINNTFSYSDDILTNNLDKAILTLNATSGDVIDADSSTLENGKISVGVHDYDYTLTWVGSNTDTAELKFDYVESSKSYNKNLAGSATTMAPGIMAYNLPATQTTNHYMSSMLRTNRNAFVTAEQEETNWNLWMTPSYGYTKRSGGGDRIGYDVNTYGTTFGFDVSPFDNNNAILGVAFSIYQQDFDATHTDVDGTTYLGQIYGGVTLPKDIEVLGNIGFGRVNYDQKRTVKGERLTADFSSDIFFVGTQISKPFALTESVQIRPFFAYDYLNITVDSFNEKGETYNLHSSSYDHDFHRTQLGTALTWSSDMGVDFGAKAFYQNLAGDRKAKTDIYFINDANQTKELSIGDAMARDSFGLGLSAATSLTNNLSLEGNYQLNLASHTQSHQAKFTLSYAF